MTACSTNLLSSPGDFHLYLSLELDLHHVGSEWEYGSFAFEDLSAGSLEDSSDYVKASLLYSLQRFTNPMSPCWLKSPLKWSPDCRSVGDT